MKATIVVDADKTCSVVIDVGWGPDIVKGLTPEQATAVKHLLQHSFKLGESSAYEKVCVSLNQLRYGQV